MQNTEQTDIILEPATHGPDTIPVPAPTTENSSPDAWAGSTIPKSQRPALRSRVAGLMATGRYNANKHFRDFFGTTYRVFPDGSLRII